MSTTGDLLRARVEGMLSAGATARVIARRLFLYDPNQIFLRDPDRGFAICDEIRGHFKVPFSAVRVAGSAQLGFSCYQNRDFIPQSSDLDIAIVSSRLFQAYSELVYVFTDRYTDLTKFERTQGQSNALAFQKYLSAGYFRPDLMPNCEQKNSWFSFFNGLGEKHKDWFKSINGGIFLSETFFEVRNSSVVSDLRKGNK